MLTYFLLKRSLLLNTLQSFLLRAHLCKYYSETVLKDGHFIKALLYLWVFVMYVLYQSLCTLYIVRMHYFVCKQLVYKINTPFNHITAISYYNK